MNAPAYNFAYLDEQTKRMIRRAIRKAIAIPGYQVPFASREMPMPYGWGTGGVQVTAAILGPDDVLKVIDQGSDDTTNAISIRKFFARTAGVATTASTVNATVIQTRHRIPEAPLHGGQVLVYPVPAARSASMRFRLIPRWCRSTSRTIRSYLIGSTRLVRCAGLTIPISTRSSPTTKAAGCTSVPIPIIARLVRR